MSELLSPITIPVSTRSSRGEASTRLDWADDEGWMVDDEGWMVDDKGWMVDDEGWMAIADFAAPPPPPVLTPEATLLLPRPTVPLEALELVGEMVDDG